MIKQLLHAVGIFVLMVSLVACSSPEEKAAGYIENADGLLQQGNLKKAEVEYKNALQINQNLPDAWYGLARIHDRRQEWKRAYAVLSKLREMSPNHVDGRIMLGQLLLAANELDQALPDAMEILEMAPNDARAHALMAELQFRLDNIEGAQQEVDKALALDADNPEAKMISARLLISQNRHADAIALLDKAIESDRENSAFYLMKIQTYREAGEPQSIANVYLALIDQFPTEVGYKQALARHYLGQENIDAAERILQQIAESEPESVGNKIRFVEFKRDYRSLDAAIALVKTYNEADSKEHRYRFLLGELYESNEQTAKAAELYEGIIADDGLQSGGLEARNKIALIEMRAGNRDRAQARIDEVLAQDKSNENALLMRAGFQISDGEIDDGIVSVRTVLRDHPDSTRALALLGQAYEANGARELAIEAYSRAFQLTPGSPVIANKLAGYLMLERQAAQADKVLQESLNRGNRSAEALVLLAQAKLALGEWDTAERLARQLQQIEGHEAISMQLLGVAYQGQYQQAASIEAFKQAHKLAPSAEQPVVALVRTYVENGQQDEARRFLESILEVDSDNVTAHMLLGEWSVAHQQIPDAITHFSEAIKADPQLVAGYRRLAVVYSSQGEIDKATAVIEQGMKAIPDNPLLSIHMAAIHEKYGDVDDAIEIYQAMVDKDDGAVVARNNLANLLTEHRTDQASMDRARKIAIDLRDSQIPQFRDTYAWAAVKSGINLEEAVVILEGLAREYEQVDIYAYHLGEAYRRRGDSANAIAYLQKAIKLSPPGSDISTRAKQSLEQLL